MAAQTLDELRRRFEADPASPDFVEWAEQAAALGAHAEAASFLRRGLASHPDRIDGHVALGRVLLQLRAPQEARAAFEAALACSPRDPALHAAIGDILFEQGLRRSAANFYKKAHALDPTDARYAALFARAAGDPADPGSARAASAEAPPPPGNGSGSPREIAAATSTPPEEAAPNTSAEAPPPPGNGSPREIAAATSNSPEEAAPNTSAEAPPPLGNGSGSPREIAAATTTPPEEAAPNTSAEAPPPLGNGNGGPPDLAAATPPPVPSAPKGGPPRLPSRAAEAKEGEEDPFDFLPKAPPRHQDEPPPPETSAVAEQAASAAAAYEQELRERLAAEQERPPTFFQRHRLAISLCLLLGVAATVGIGTWQKRRIETRADDVARFTAQARNVMLRDTLPAWLASLEALREVLDRDENAISARALEAWTLANLAVRWEHPAGDRHRAKALLGEPEEAAEPEIVLATRLLLAEGEEERQAVEEEILAVPPDEAGAQIHSLAGSILLERGQLAEGIDRFNAALSRMPNHVPTLVRIGEHYRGRREYGEALRYDELALATVADHALALLGVAEARLATSAEGKGLQETLAALERLDSIAVPAGHRDRHVILQARLLTALDRRKEAVKRLEPLDLRVVADPNLLPELAAAYVEAGAADRAADLFRPDTITRETPLVVREAWMTTLLALERFRAATAVPMAPGDRRLHQLAGIAWMELGDHRRGRATLRRTATREGGKMPVDVVVWLGLADLRDGSVARARRNLERLGTGPRARVTGRWAWAELLVRERRLEEAEAALREAIDRDRHSVEARCSLARLLLLRGDPEGARTWAEAALARNPFHTEAQRALGEAALLAGDLEAAEAALAIAAERAPSDAATLALRARLALARGDASEARRRLEQAGRGSGNHPAILEARGALARIEGDAAAAEKALLAAARSVRHDPRPWMAVAEVRNERGDVKGAVRAWDQALLIDPASVAALVGKSRTLASDGKHEAARDALQTRIDALQAVDAQDPRLPTLREALTSLAARAQN